MTPEELLARVAEGDDDAFALLYQVVVGPVFRMVRYVVLDVAQSEEVTQEVMVELWRTAARYDPAQGSVLNWTLMLARRRAVDRVRAAASQTRHDQLFGSMFLDRAFDDVVETVTTNLEHQQVRLCLRTLTERQRESVLLAYYGGYSYQEVAELLRTPLGTIKTRLRDGLLRLRACLGDGT